MAPVGVTFKVERESNPLPREDALRVMLHSRFF